MTSTGQTPRGAGGQIAANSHQVNSSKNKKKSCKRSKSKKSVPPVFSSDISSVNCKYSNDQ